MNRGNDRLRMLLIGAVATGVFGSRQFVQAAGPIPVFINPKNPGTMTAKPQATVTSPRLLTVSGSDSSTITQVGQSTNASASDSGSNSEVMRQLQLLYKQDGREMPEMNTDIKPVPTGASPADANNNAAPARPAAAPAAPASGGIRMQQPVPPTASAVQPATQPAAPPAKPKYPVISYFKKLMPGKKDPTPTKAPADYRPDIAPVPPVVASQPTSKPRQETVMRTASSNPDAVIPLLESQPRSPFVTAVGIPEALPMPIATIDVIPPSPNGNSTIAAPAVDLPPLLAKPNSPKTEVIAQIPQTPLPLDANPFTEMSEAEADKKLELNPFTGLTLDVDAGSANGKVVLPANPPKQDAATPIAPPDAEDPFADELRKMGIGPSATPSTEPSKLTPPTPESPSFDGIEDQTTREKIKKIHERGGMKGLKGFCPVSLRDQRELIDARADFHSTFRGQKFHFADADAKLKFDEEPARFAPAAYGADVVALTRDKDVVEGTLDFAAWFKGRLYLFGTQETHDTFVSDPSQYATPAGIE